MTQRFIQKTRSLLAPAALAAGLVLAASGGAEAAKEVKVAIGLGPKHPVVSDGWPAYIEAVEKETNGSLKFRLFTSGALLTLRATLGGVHDGVADAGVYALTYWPAEFPIGNMIGDFAMLGEDAAAMAGATSEFSLLHCPDCLSEFKAQGMVYNGTYSTTPYRIISKGKMSTLEEMKGKKLRIAGSVWTRWLSGMGGVAANLPANDMFDGLNQGVIDGAIQATSALKGYSLWDVAKDITLIPLGTYHSLSLMGYNKDFWADLTDAERKVLLDNASVAITSAIMRYYVQDEEVLAETAKHGVTVHQPSADLAKYTKEFALKDVNETVKAVEAQGTVKDARGKADTYIALIEKWTKLTAPVLGDKEKLQALYKSEIFDKLDPKTYGK